MELMVALAAFLCVPVFLAAFAWYAVRARRSGGGQSLMAPFEEIWDPIANKTNIEIQVESQRHPDVPSPGDPPGQRRRGAASRSGTADVT
ncbi:hypothetical protein [Amycolatopsis suaedae]|uniref:Uncharacterized protein n=1 Tax=Amycolatopsis suaedae TaxID=2510978 RepID=A0A4Q7J898_9PSEU|nr:hypothetical protein [Amycolatopsis suaedae]RZQ63911.1 hypothetical protein EWH70_12255 [Amycolatopsis suaedae]